MLRRICDWIARKSSKKGMVTEKGICSYNGGIYRIKEKMYDSTVCIKLENGNLRKISKDEFLQCHIII